MKEILSRQETAEFLGCSVRHVDNLVKRGELMPFRLGRRVMFALSTLRELIGVQLQSNETALGT